MSSSAGSLDFFPPEPVAPTLRPYQTERIEKLRSHIRDGIKRQILQAPCGAGKTVMAAEIIRSALERETYCLFLAHRRELVYQCSNKLADFGVPHGIIMAGEEPLARHVQVGSVQTLAARRDKLELPEWGLIVLDECHRSLAPTFRRVIDENPQAVVLGLTATPARGDGRGLGDIYEELVCSPTYQDLTDMGYLVPARYFAPTQPDLEGLTVRMGDYVESELSERMDQPVLVGDVVDHWARIAEGRKTVVFASSVAHSIHLCQSFQRAGVAAAHIDGKTPKDERDETLRELSRGALQVVCNCMVLTEGWDQPDVACVVLARPTKSVVLYLQMAGRGLRAFPDKSDCIIIDHAGAVYEHGFLHEFTDWDLSETSRQQNSTQVERKEKNASPITCQQCFTVYVGRPACPTCGHVPERKGREVAYIDARLGEVEIDQRAARIEAIGKAEKKLFYQGLLAYSRDRGYKDGWAAYKYKEKYGDWPEFSKVPADSIPAVVANYVRHMNIKYAKSRQKRYGAK